MRIRARGTKRRCEPSSLKNKPRNWRKCDEALKDVLGNVQAGKEKEPGQRPGGEGKGKGRPGKKGSEASFEGVQYVLNDDRHRGDHRGQVQPRPPRRQGRKLAVRNEVALSPTRPPARTSQDSARVTAQKAHKPAVRNGVVLGDFGKPGPGPKGPQIRGKQSHGKPSGCSSCKGNKPGHGPKGRKPVARARPTAVPKVDLAILVVRGRR